MASHLTRITRLARLPRRPLALTQHSSAPSVTILSLQRRQPTRNASDSTNKPFQSAPSPPRLPPDQQAEFERLQRTANTQEGFNATSTPDFTSVSSAAATTTPTADGVIAATTPAIEDELASMPLRKGAPPEFEGDVNPKTGEVGGPKNEPLRWGPGGDYSFNGRVTDF
ncbi:DUF1674-domain-containing protein [Jackrogersella minutella]|nr:DUF1674-domain-containing protein [Jackrogersella minutella]